MQEENFAKCHLTVFEGHSMKIRKKYGVEVLCCTFYMILIWRIFKFIICFGPIKPIKIFLFSLTLYL